MICRTRPAPTAAPRPGFTLPELMVTMLVVAILMTILGVAVSISGSLVGQARGKGLVMDQQRVAMNTLVRDLKFKHFPEDGKPNGRERVSDLRTDRATEYKLNPPPPPPASPYKWRGYKPPRGGYFRAYSPPVDNSVNFFEGKDGDGFDSSRSANHYVMFTILVPGGAPQDTLTADVPFLNSPATAAYPLTFHAAEVAYFLVDTKRKTPGGVTLYDLVRRQRGCAMNQYDAAEYSKVLNGIPTGPPSPAPYMAEDDPIQVIAAVDTNPAPGAAAYEVSDLSRLTLEAYRLRNPDEGKPPLFLPPFPPAKIAAYRVGDDVLLSNVISFELKYTGSSDRIAWPRPASINTDFPYDTLPHDGSKYGGLYDTFTSSLSDWDDAKYLAGSTTATTTPVASTPPLCPIRITGVSIRIRCWDPKSKSGRQTTKNVDL